jgi:hypothetical protein
MTGAAPARCPSRPAAWPGEQLARRSAVTCSRSTGPASTWWASGLLHARQASRPAGTARYPPRPPCRRISRHITDGSRPIRAAIIFSSSSVAIPREISSRSASASILRIPAISSPRILHQDQLLRPPAIKAPLTYCGYKTQYSILKTLSRTPAVAIIVAGIGR